MLQWLLLWFFGSILAFISCTFHWEDYYQNYDCGAILYKTWQSMFYHVNLSPRSVRPENTVTDHSFLSKFWKKVKKKTEVWADSYFKLRWRPKSNENIHLVHETVFSYSLVMIPLYHVEPKQIKQRKNPNKKQKIRLTIMQEEHKQKISYFCIIIRQRSIKMFGSWWYIQKWLKGEVEAKMKHIQIWTI